ncbi:argininosuccinate lyase [Pseudochelatococcus sp. B33]
MSARPDYQGYRNNAGGRLAEPMVDHLGEGKSAIEKDEIPAIHAFDIAHAIMLTEQRIVERAVGADILRGLQEMERRGMAETRLATGGGIHSAETFLIREYGDAIGGWLHLGRSSGDLHAVSRRVALRGQVHRMLAALGALREALLDVASEHLSTVMPGYTHGQHAQPITYALWATMFEEAFSRDAGRLLSFHERLNLSPAGAAIMTGSDFPVDRTRVSTLLGFDAPLGNTLDAILSHDIEMEGAAALALLAQTLSRMASDLHLWSGFEFGFVELPDRYCGTSSIMPQKKNPDALEDMKSMAVQSLSSFVTTFTTNYGPTGFPIFEQRHSFHLQAAFGETLAIRLEALAPMLRDMAVKVERMRALAGANWAQVTDVAGMLVREARLSWRTAHHVVGAFIQSCVEQGISPDQTRVGHLAQAAAGIGHRLPPLDPAAFAQAMDPTSFVLRRHIAGGPAPEFMARSIATARARLADDAAAHARLVAKVEAAARERERAMQRIIDEHPGGIVAGDNAVRAKIKVG